MEFGAWSLGNGHEWEFMANASRAGSDLGQIQSSGCVQGTQYVIMTSLHTKNKQQESRIAGKRWKIAIKTWLYFDFFPAKFGRLESSHNCQLSWQIETWAIWYAPFIWYTPLYTFFLYFLRWHAIPAGCLCLWGRIYALITHYCGSVAHCLLICGHGQVRLAACGHLLIAKPIHFASSWAVLFSLRPPSEWGAKKEKKINQTPARTFAFYGWN